MTISILNDVTPTKKMVKKLDSNCSKMMEKYLKQNSRRIYLSDSSLCKKIFKHRLRNGRTNKTLKHSLQLILPQDWNKKGLKNTLHAKLHVKRIPNMVHFYLQIPETAKLKIRNSKYDFKKQFSIRFLSSVPLPLSGGRGLSKKQSF